MSNERQGTIIIMMLTIIMITIAWKDCGASDEVELKITLGSYHLPRDDYCEFNPGLGATFHKQLTVLVYRNSECNTSVMGSWTNPINETFSYSFGGAAGYDYLPIVPFVSLNAKLGDHAFVGVIPGSLLGGETVFFYGVNF